MNATLHMTAKQTLLLNLLKRGNDDGDFLDMGELHDRLPYTCTRQALQFSLKYLEQHGLVEPKGKETRRGRSRLMIGLTPQGFSILKNADVGALSC